MRKHVWRKRGGELALWALVAVLGGGILGCNGDKPGEVAGAVFYPSPPYAPRLQFLMSFSDTRDWSTKRSSFADFIAGSNAPVGGDIKSPYGIAARDGKVYVCDLGSYCVHVIDIANRKSTRLGTRQQLTKPVNITIDADGTKYVCDTQKARIAVFDAEDKFVRFLQNPNCTPMDVGIYGDELYVIDVAAAELEAWTKAGKFLKVLAKKGDGPGLLRMPTNLTVGPDGRIYVTDTLASIVNMYNGKGQYLGSVGAPGDRPGFFARPKGLCFDGEGRLYVVDAQWEVAQIFSKDRRILLSFGGAGTGPEAMGLPAGVSVDTTSLPAFRKYVDKDFRPEYLLFVTNQFGRNKVAVYAFGKSIKAEYPEELGIPMTQPSTRPATRPATRPTTAPAAPK